MRDERLNRCEVDNPVRLHASTDFLTKHPAQQRTSTRVNPHDLPAPIDLRDFDLIRDDDAPAHQVDEVACQEVFGEEDLSGTSLETAQVHTPALECHAPFGEPANLLDRHEEVSALDTDHGTHNRRVRIVAETRDQVLDASNLVAVRVVDRTVQERREVQNFSHGYGFQHLKPTVKGATLLGCYRRAKALATNSTSSSLMPACVTNRARFGEIVPPSTPSAPSWRTTGEPRGDRTRRCWSDTSRDRSSTRGTRPRRALRADGSRVVVLQSFDHGVEGDEAGCREKTGLTHCPAQSLALDASALDERRRPREQRAHGRTEPLREGGHHRRRRRDRLCDRRSRGNNRIEEPRAVEMERAVPDRASESTEVLNFPGCAARIHVRVFNGHESNVRLMVELRINDLFDVRNVEHAPRIVHCHELDARVSRCRAHFELTRC